MKNIEKIYRGNVFITKENAKEWEIKLKDVTKIIGDIIADQGSSITIPSMALAQTGDIIADKGASITIPSMALAQTGDIIADQGASITIPSMALAQTGDIRINSVNCKELVKYLIKKFKHNTWIIEEYTPIEIINSNFKNAKYYLNNVSFSREWFIKIKNDTFSAAEVFVIDNIEHRRIAYQFMDKIKMKSLKNFKVLDKFYDAHGYWMQIVSFNVQNMNEDLKFLNCFCPSTGREYYIGTKYDTCLEAKSNSFGLDEVEWIDEW